MTKKSGKVRHQRSILEIKLAHSAGIVQRLVRVGMAATFVLGLGVLSGQDSWTQISTIPEELNGMVSTDTQLVGYCLSPALTTFWSNDGVNWIERPSSITGALAVRSDGQGSIFAVVRVKVNIPVVGTRNTSQLWRTTDGQNWSHLGDLATNSRDVPVNFDLVATQDRLVIKLWTIEGRGSISPPPQPLFSIAKTDFNDFVQVSDGDSIIGLHRFDQGVAATRLRDIGEERVCVHSADGLQWEDLFGVAYTNPPNEIISIWQTSFFFFGFGGVTVYNGISGKVPVQIPSGTFFGWETPVAFFYDSRKIVLVATDQALVSLDYAESWDATAFTWVCGCVNLDGTIYLANRVTSETQIYKWVEPPIEEPIPMNVPLEISLDPIGNITVAVRPSSEFIQLKCSDDMQTWHLHGIPIRGDSASIDRQGVGSRLFFMGETRQP